MQRHDNAVAQLAAFIEQQLPGSRTAATLTRDTLERWLAIAGEQRHGTRISAGHLCAVRGFLDAVRRLEWAPEPPALTAVHSQHFARRIALAARFLPEFVMVQVETADLQHAAPAR